MAPLRRFATGILPLFAFAACAQIIGLSDYEKGEEPDGDGGESPGGGGGKGGSGGSSGKATGGTGRGGTAGKGGTGGSAALGGEGGVAGDGGVGGEDEGGAAGTSGRGGTGGSSGKSSTGGAGGAGMAGGGTGGAGNAGGGMGGSAGGGTCTNVPVTLRGGNFDSDTSVWASYGDPSARTIVVTGASVGITPNSAPNVAHFGQVDDWYAGHFQRISIPVGAVTLTLTGHRYVTTLEDSTTTEYDLMGMQLWDDAVTPMGLVGSFVQLSNLQATDSWVPFSYTVSVSARAGQMVDFDMWAENEVSNVTNFYIDSLVLTAFVCL